MKTHFVRLLLILLIAVLVTATFSACPKKGKNKDDKVKPIGKTEGSKTKDTGGKPPDGTTENTNVRININGVWDVYSVIESDTSGSKTPGTEMPQMVWHIRMEGNTAVIEPEGSEEPIRANINGVLITAKPENTEPWYDISGTIAPESNFMAGTNKSSYEENGSMQETIDSWTAIKRDDGTTQPPPPDTPDSSDGSSGVDSGDGGKPPAGDDSQGNAEPATNPPEGGSSK